MSADLKVEYWTRDKIKPDAGNPRTHSAEQVAQIATSISEFGFTNPILVDTKGALIAGHGRLMAANSLELDKVPVIVLKGLSAAQKRAYMVADNQLTILGDWDFGKLGDLVRDLANEGFDTDLTFLSGPTLEEIFGGAADADMRTSDKSSGSGLNYLKFDGNEVPLGDDELEFLRERLARHIERNAVTVGFIREEFMDVSS